MSDRLCSRWDSVSENVNNVGLEEQEAGTGTERVGPERHRQFKGTDSGGADHLPHDLLEGGRLLGLFLVVESDLFAEFPRIRHYYGVVEVDTQSPLVVDGSGSALHCSPMLSNAIQC